MARLTESSMYAKPKRCLPQGPGGSPVLSTRAEGSHPSYFSKFFPKSSMEPSTVPMVLVCGTRRVNKVKARLHYEVPMKTIAIIFCTLCFANAAFAQQSCKLQASGKSLHGAALSSFAKKCCADQAAAQKLHGAAQTSFTKKCVADATGS